MYGTSYYQPAYGGGYQAGYMPQTGGAAPDQLAYLRGMVPPQQAQAQQGAGNGIIWIQGEAGAKSYLVAPGNTVMLMDSEATVFYIKSADASGVPLPLRIFDYKERKSEEAQPTPAASDSKEYITREEFDAFRASITARMGTEEVTDGE